MPIITLTTDFGTRDYYVAAMKGVIAGIAPGARVVDVTHDIEPHNVLGGAFVLCQVLPWFPDGTIHLAVVDPGVGSTRRIVLGRFGGRYVVAPDNGLFSFIQRETPADELYVVEDRRYFVDRVSATFHGRDIIAPVAAHLARGVEASAFGPAIDSIEMLSVECRARLTGSVLVGCGLYVDRFGTIVSNIHEDQLAELAVAPDAPDALEVVVNDVILGPIRSTFCDVDPGEPVALTGGSGFLEVAVNQGHAAARFGCAEAVRIEVRARLGLGGTRDPS